MSQVKLNLGAGRFPFPYERGAVPNSDYVEPLPDEVFEDGWINVDKFSLPGVQEKVDLFKFPWIRSSNGNPFNENSVDVITAFHLVEHIPHEVKLHPRVPLGWKQYAEYVQGTDGFFVFFSEVWRILKPDGVIHVRCPYATVYDSLCDPTHTRFITPGTFGYLTAPNDDTPFDYGNHARFEMVGNITWRMPNKWAEASGNYTPQGFMDLLRENYSVATELRVTLRAVKD